MTIRAVFFDMGGTIETFGFTRELRLEATAGIQQRLLQVGINLNLTNEQLLDVISRGLEHYKRWSIQTMEELPPRRVWREYVLRGFTFDQAKLDAIAEDLAFHVETRYYLRTMRSEIPAVLQAIKQMGLKIGLISNVNSLGQVPTNLKEYGIRHYFDPVILSSEYGRRKPDPAIFHYAARLAHVPTSACLYVGDRIARDIIGARKAGFGLAVQIEHDFEHGEDDTGAVPDFMIGNMTALLGILKEDRRSSGAPETGPIKALLFDAGDILYYRPEKASRLRAFLKEVTAEAKGLFDADKELLTEQAYRGEIDREQYREGLLRLYGITQPEQLERGRQIFEQEDNKVEFFTGVRETLIALKDQGYLLGIVTDTANSVHAKLSWFERGGFGHVWDSIVSSRELGRRKPDPEIYLAALEQLGLSPAQAVFVGHKASELEGARAVGIKTIAFNYEADARADYFIEKFSDLPSVSILCAPSQVDQDL